MDERKKSSNIVPHGKYVYKEIRFVTHREHRVSITKASPLNLFGK
jgi:hypothetical protein